MARLWLRLYTDFATNPKVQILSETLQRRYVMLLCLHADDKYHDAPLDELALALRVTVDEMQVTLAELHERKLLNADYSIRNWEKRQYISDLKDPTAAERQRRHRTRKRDNRNASVTSHLPESDTDTDTDTEDTEKRLNANLFSVASAVTHAPSQHEIAQNGKTAPTKRNGNGTDPPCPYQALAELWNQCLPELPHVLPVESWSTERKRHVKARWHELPDTRLWAQLFTRVRESKFLMGELTNNGRSPFQCNFSWIIKPENFIKILEGNYR